MQKLTGLVLVSTFILTACGGSDSNSSSTAGGVGISDARGTLQQNPPPLTVSMSTSAITANPSWQQNVTIFGSAPICGVDIHYLKFGTVGGAGEATNATGALMLPTGSNPACSGPRPIVVYAHGTAFTKAYNLASSDPNNEANGETLMIAVDFAAQGFIVVATNYAGYDTSQLPYHPYLNADQQSKDVIDSLTAARAALPSLGGATDSGKLFITGYSQGGFVAMATHKAMQAAGQTVTAAAPSSGPYAMGAFGDTVFLGRPSLLINVLATMIVTSYQHAYGNIYANLTDIYNPTYAANLANILPSSEGLNVLSTGLIAPSIFSNIAPTAPVGASASLQAVLNADTIPPTSPALLASTYAAGFGPNFLVTNNYRINYIMDALANPDGSVPTLTTGLPAVSPANTIRQGFKINDFRNWTANRPVLLCGGNADPMVYFNANTQNMQQYWTAPSPAAMASGLFTVLDVDSAITGANDPYASAKTVFTDLRAYFVEQAIASGATDGGASAVLQNYHPVLVSSACMLAASNFFQQVLASGQ
ncbi:alpha/beta hydrolase family protein [Solimicrobium silvestre]|uniref:Alpha/beta hydrolase family n=1 Tax=Solimicrobium silvestre TaxID=2099400 RepID=A0A2S9H4C4_9BURK|nr:prolyl oligopeptidase family serine peptidase [Solimicrobium silvestre]PRC94817.1 Alpha/beta hydrolase family [Solimicrobium silvestre]